MSGAAGGGGATGRGPAPGITKPSGTLTLPGTGLEGAGVSVVGGEGPLELPGATDRGPAPGITKPSGTLILPGTGLEGAGVSVVGGEGPLELPGATDRGPAPGITKPSGTLILPGAGFGGVFSSSLSSRTLPSCTFFFFPSNSSSSVFRRLVLPWSLVARSLLNPDVFSPFVSPREPTRNWTARMFSIPGLTVMSVRESPIFFVATGTALAESVDSVLALPWAQLGFWLAVVTEP